MEGSWCPGGQTRQELFPRQSFSTPPRVLSRALATWQPHGLGTRQPYWVTARCSWREAETQKRSFSIRAGVFTSTKPMIAARVGHIATLLKNCEILFAGGTEGNVIALGELF